MSFDIALALATAQTGAVGPAEGDTVAYVVKRGDTFDRLGRDYLVPAKNWQALVELTRIRDPKRLPVGRVIFIPRSWLRYSVEPARLISYRGTVVVTLGTRPARPAVGLSIGEGAQLATGPNSFISLGLADRSTIVIPSQSRVVLRQLRRILLTGTVDYRIEVQGGRLQTKVTPLNGSGGQFRINTPVSMTAVRGTEFRVTYDVAAATGGTEVLSGTVSASGLVDSGQVVLRAQAGAVIERAQPPRIVKLLDAPSLVNAGRIQSGDAVDFQAAAVAGATRYRAVIAEDAGFVENISEQYSESGRFSFPEIPNGNLFVRVSALDRYGLEGLAQSYSFRRRLASIRGQVEADDDRYRFRWTGSGSGARRYRFQLMKGTAESVPIVDEVGLEEEALTLRKLPPGLYFWRVGVVQIDDEETIETWTDLERLTIAAPSSRRDRQR